MDTQLIALLMFLLLSYLLFRRPASAVTKRYPTELDFQIGHSVFLQKELSKKRRVIVFALSVIGALIVLMCQTAFAQSTIFNIPTTDAVAPKKVYFEFDFLSHLESHDKGGFQAYIPRVVVGV